MAENLVFAGPVDWNVPDYSVLSQRQKTLSVAITASPTGGTITGFDAGKHRKGFGGAIMIVDPQKADEAKWDVISPRRDRLVVEHDERAGRKARRRPS
jgi:hypothetical protein